MIIKDISYNQPISDCCQNTDTGFCFEWSLSNEEDQLTAKVYLNLIQALESYLYLFLYFQEETFCLLTSKNSCE